MVRSNRDWCVKLADKSHRYHKVSQSCGPEGFTCAVNYWYDMEFSGPFHPLCSFLRDVAAISQDDGQEIQ